MIYPRDFENKLAFADIRQMLRDACLSVLGQEKVDDMQIMDNSVEINEKLARVNELKQLLSEYPEFPMTYFFDMRAVVSRLRIANTHIEEAELFDLRRSLDTIDKIKSILIPETFTLGDDVKYPHLQILAEEISTFPYLVHRIDQILDRNGKIRDTASPTLQRIRLELRAAAGSVSKILHNILRQAQQDGYVERDVTPSVRDGRLVIPVAPAMKRKIQGIVHDESGSGKTVFIEPLAAVEANNKIRELEDDERQEVLKSLTEFEKVIRPDVQDIVASYALLAHIDFLRAKLIVAERFKAITPEVCDKPMIDWIQARHPLLMLSLEKHNKAVVPLDIKLESEGRILIISGPNAGGKSVCLKTVGLLQYMLQCGLPIPIKEGSRCGVFSDLMIDIGDEQSIENDLSTYSSHLQNMKAMLKACASRTLIYIDQSGGGPEPNICFSLAESMLKRCWEKGSWAVITTHYQNLKHFADDHKGVVNGAMLYNRHEMQPLFQLQIGQPGSSFAVEIARKIGIPEEIIQDASDIVGQDYVQSDRYLQDIVRDKRYWENKRQNIHQREKEMQKTIERFESSVDEVDKERRAILRRAKEQAEELLKETNKRIENAIREIREQQAEREATKRIRAELTAFKEGVNEIDTTANDAFINKKIEQIKARQKRKEERKAQKAAEAERPKEKQPEQPKIIEAGRLIKGTYNLAALQQSNQSIIDKKPSNATRTVVDEHRAQFRPELDLRGMRADEAYDKLVHFIDDAILVGIRDIRVLHGKGNGILRETVRQYCATVPNIQNFKDEHVQFGGSGITVVTFFN